MKLEEHREKQKTDSFRTAVYCIYLMCMLIVLAVTINIIDNTESGSSVLIGIAVSCSAYLVMEVIKHAVYLYKKRKE